MFTGALAASHYGTPRTTTDVDIIVKIARENVQTGLISALKDAKLQVDEKRIEVALKSDYRIVTFKDSKTPLTVDIILSDGKLEKKNGVILDLPTFYQTPEDLILSKLRMIKATVSREKALKDEEDIRAILRFTRVDLNAVKRHARKNGTTSILKALAANKPHKETKHS
jgi:hypothetical protein